MKRLTLPENVRYILDKLTRSGYEAYIVGGCTRDMLIGKTPTDYDITTSATPEEVKSVFSEYRTLDTGIKHGTVTLLYLGAPYEITTYRTEGEYTDSRHPDSVSFTRKLSEDLSRRDFTMNAICADRDGTLTDMFGGIEDIENRLIRTVGDPGERFTEDALRILRAIRFSATLGFKLEDKTAAAVHFHKARLSGISGERIYSEIVKLLGGEFAYGVLKEYKDVIMTVMPTLVELRLPPEESFLSADFRERLISIFALGGGENPEAAFDEALAALHTDSKIRRLGRAALENLNAPTDTQGALLRLLFRLGEEGAELTAAVKELAGGASVIERLSRAEKSGIPYKFSDMAVTGEDFRRLGFLGKEIGEAMESTLFAIMDGKIKNNKNDIEIYIKELKCKL